MKTISNRGFFDEEFQAKEGRIYTREIYEKDGYMRIGIDRSDGKGQVMIKLEREDFERDIIEPYFSQLLKQELDPATTMKILQKYWFWYLKKESEKKKG